MKPPWATMLRSRDKDKKREVGTTPQCYTFVGNKQVKQDNVHEFLRTVMQVYGVPFKETRKGKGKHQREEAAAATAENEQTS